MYAWVREQRRGAAGARDEREGVRLAERLDQVGEELRRPLLEHAPLAGGACTGVYVCVGIYPCEVHVCMNCMYVHA